MLTIYRIMQSLQFDIEDNFQSWATFIKASQIRIGFDIYFMFVCFFVTRFI